MTRLSTAFAKAHPALVAFITAGDGDTAANLDALVAGGADVIELGMPFTDPMADGPAIQEGEHPQPERWHHDSGHLLAIASAFRSNAIQTRPLVLMGYANPMTIRGGDWFASECNKAGVDGVICVDIPPEEDPELGPALRSAGIDLIRLATPDHRYGALANAVLDGASGLSILCVSVAGITGLQVRRRRQALMRQLARLKVAYRSAHRGWLWRSHRLNKPPTSGVLPMALSLVLQSSNSSPNMASTPLVRSAIMWLR